MNLYNFTGTETSRWGTRPQIRGEGWGALDLLDVVTSSQGIDDVAMTDVEGNPVSIGHIIATARADATTPEAQEYWASHMAWAVLDKVRPFGTDVGREITDNDWRQAGHWWAEHVGATPEPAVLNLLHERLYPRDLALIEQGVRQFEAAATPVHESRVGGTLASSKPVEQPPRPSRLRGTAAPGASLPGTRTTTGGATGGHAAPGTNPHGRPL